MITLTIGCCSDYKKCSDAGCCIKTDSSLYDELYKDCLYAVNLNKGLNFYTPYNENNKARAEEYKRKQDNTGLSIGAKVKDNTTESSISNSDERHTERYKNAYIVIGGRQFYIGRRSGNGGLTYSLGNEGVKKLISDIGELPIEVDTEFIESKFVDENGSQQDRVEWKPYITIGDTKYNLMNSNMRALKESTSRMLADYFSGLGIETVCECMGNSRKDFTSLRKDTLKTVQNTKPKEEIKGYAEERKETYVQLSLFDL
jgi:hypothetical protein